MKTKYRRNTPIRTKLLERCVQTEGCWEWVAGKDKNKYGRIWHNNKNQLAHVVAYQEFIGWYQQGLHVRHSCDNPSCINPRHLILGTHADNMKDKSIRKRIHGSKNPGAKFSDNDRELAGTLPGRITDIATQLGMSICYVCTLRKRYMHMKKYLTTT